ncbi:MAG: hypothetical protein WCD53_05795 [Microcoleus sp.]
MQEPERIFYLGVIKGNGFDPLILFWQNLEKQAIDYSWAHHRNEAMISIPVCDSFSLNG